MFSQITIVMKVYRLSREKASGPLVVGGVQDDYSHELGLSLTHSMNIFHTAVCDVSERLVQAKITK